MEVPAVISTQDGQLLHGSPGARPSRGPVQLSALASSRAVVVLPVPRGPENR